MSLVDEELISTDPVPWLSKRGVQTWVLRTDKVHDIISGNKWFKLRYYIEDAQRKAKKRLVTFGGAFSNHIVATAAAAKLAGLSSIGIIRGEAPAKMSHTLQQARAFGMEFRFLTREDYAAKHISADILEDEENYIIDEGGYGRLGARGAATIRYNKNLFDYVCCAVGTGTMMSGLINSRSNQTKITGFSVLRNYADHEHQIAELLDDAAQPVNIISGFHFGGYAKVNAALILFMNELYKNSGIPTDFVYTGKLFYGVLHLIENGYFGRSKNILIVHSGGLQGNLSLPAGTLMF